MGIIRIKDFVSQTSIVIIRDKNYLKLQGYMILIIYAIILKLNLLLIFKYIFEKPGDIKKL